MGGTSRPAAGDGWTRLRFILLSEQLLDMPEEEALWVVAHEIAHSRLNHFGEGDEYADEVAADRLVEEWGFHEPLYRKEVRELYRKAT